MWLGFRGGLSLIFLGVVLFAVQVYFVSSISLCLLLISLRLRPSRSLSQRQLLKGFFTRKYGGLSRADQKLRCFVESLVLVLGSGVVPISLGTGSEGIGGPTVFAGNGGGHGGGHVDAFLPGLPILT